MNSVCLEMSNAILKRKKEFRCYRKDTCTYEFTETYEETSKIENSFVTNKL